MSQFYYFDDRATANLGSGTFQNEVQMEPISRRKLLTSSAAALAASTFPLSEAQSAHTKVAGAFTVRADEGRPSGLWLVHGEKAFLTKVSGADVGKKYAAIEARTPPGHGPNLHVHLGQNESIFMLKGRIGVQCGSDRTVLGAGDAFMAPADVPHAFVALGAEPAHMLVVFDPASDMEGFFAEYAALIDTDGEPDQKKIAEAYAKHGMKVLGPPLIASSFAL
jgi:quercetin dioxygenase-like cupin family protein